MGPKAVAMVAEVIDRLEGRPPGTGRPPVPTLKVVAALRFFVREGVQWRELRATAGRASGATLRRRLDEWDGTALLRRVHLALIRMVRAGPEPASWDVVVDSCSVRAKRGGALPVGGAGTGAACCPAGVVSCASTGDANRAASAAAMCNSLRMSIS